MSMRIASTAAIVGLALVAAAGPGEAHQARMGQGMMGQGVGPGMMGQGMMGQGPGPMGQGMGQGYGPGPMGPGMMHPGMGQGMGPGMMMGQGMGAGMMGEGAGPGRVGPGMMSQGMGQGFGPGPMGPGMWGFRVVPMMHLSTDDVRVFLERHISAHGLMRLQVGDVTQTDDDTITADIVTQDGSLAIRLEIDAYTGFVESIS